MGIRISGHVEVQVTRDNEDAIYETVSGFHLEQEPDFIEPDRDDGLFYYDAIYKSIVADYAVEVHVSVNGSVAQIDQVVVVDVHENVFVEVVDDSSLTATFER